MSFAYQVKIRAQDENGNKRTITFSPLYSSIDDTETLNDFAQKLQPLITETITSAQCYRIRTVDNYESTVSAGIDAIPNSTKDSTIYRLENAQGSKIVTISKSASAAESDTAAFTAYATAVYRFASELTTHYEGDYAVDDVTLRAVYDTQIENPS